MTPEQTKIFVDIIRNYFNKNCFDHVHVCSPYLIREEEFSEVCCDFSGVIKISGQVEGVVIFTASEDILKEMMKQLGTGSMMEDKSNLADMAGEIANIISGNAQEKLESRFEISRPELIQQQPEQELLYEGNACVIPMKWKNHFAALVISVNRKIK